MVFKPDLKHLAVLGVVQTKKNIVILQLQTNGIFHIESAQLAEPRMAGVECARYSTVPLVELIAMYRIIQEIGKVQNNSIRLSMI